jgi:hypothetical protein
VEPALRSPGRTGPVQSCIHIARKTQESRVPPKSHKNEKGGVFARPPFVKNLRWSLQHLHVLCLPPFGTFDDVELYWLALF